MLWTFFRVNIKSRGFPKSKTQSMQQTQKSKMQIKQKQISFVLNSFKEAPPTCLNTGKCCWHGYVMDTPWHTHAKGGESNSEKNQVKDLCKNSRWIFGHFFKKRMADFFNLPGKFWRIQKMVGDTGQTGTTDEGHQSTMLRSTCWHGINLDIFGGGVDEKKQENFLGRISIVNCVKCRLRRCYWGWGERITPWNESQNGMNK